MAYDPAVSVSGIYPKEIFKGLTMNVCSSFIQSQNQETMMSLVVQWLRPCAPSAGRVPVILVGELDPWLAWEFDSNEISQ